MGVLLVQDVFVLFGSHYGIVYLCLRTGVERLLHGNGGLLFVKILFDHRKHGFTYQIILFLTHTRYRHQFFLGGGQDVAYLDERLGVSNEIDGILPPLRLRNLVAQRIQTSEQFRVSENTVYLVASVFCSLLAEICTLGMANDRRASK